MKCLLIVAHGSRRQASNEEVRILAERISDKTGSHFDAVHSAFLELAEPSIPDGIHQCVAQGAKEIVIMPYFLAAGRHVIEDIPAEVEQTQQQYPDLIIHMAPYLGSLEAISDLMATQASEIATSTINDTLNVKYASDN